MAAYGLAVFTGAFLLFQVQPLMGKYLLPWYGGVPAVWTTCMLFFQALLLAGYAYAHLSVRWLKPRAQVILHLLLLTIALLTLPITPASSLKPQPGTDPVLRILLTLSLSIGLPYFVIAATAPLFQHWSSRTEPHRSPFKLYALSNAAALLALVSYPAFFEARFSQTSQARFWSAGLVLYTWACAWAGTRVWRTSHKAEVNTTEDSRSGLTPTTGDKALWIALPACASLLLLAVTNTICQDIAVIPLLWVVPLALYLLSFALCFAHPRFYHRAGFGCVLFPLLGLMSALLAGYLQISTTLQIVVFGLGLFVCCMVCHGEVYRLRPDPRLLTSFYLAVSAGGALGGIFVAVIAPLIFSDYLELDWGLILCGALFLGVWVKQRPFSTMTRRAAITWGGAGLALSALAVLLWQSAHRNENIRLARTRSFYGVLKVFRHEFSDPKFNMVELVHGRVAHGVQFLTPPRSASPTLYYSPKSGVGRALAALPPGRRHIGVVGLGAGTLAAYAQAGDQIRFYEINPDVARLAQTHFTYLQQSAGQVSVVLGDARLALENESPQNFDLLALDAFNSDSIPVHLLTRQAFLVYQRHLRTNGVLAINISNRSLDLEPVIGNLARLFALTAVVVHDTEANELEGILPSTWILLSRDAEFAHRPLVEEAASPLAWSGTRDTLLWTDDYTSLFPIIRWGDGSDADTVPIASVPAPNTTRSQDRMAAEIRRFREALGRAPDSPVILNNLACLLATAADPSLRDGPEAVRLAERACALTGYQNTSVVSTLAAAYAETGRFQEAVTLAEKACAMAKQRGETTLLEGNRRMLEFYRRKQPFHQPGG